MIYSHSILNKIHENKKGRSRNARFYTSRCFLTKISGRGMACMFLRCFICEGLDLLILDLIILHYSMGVNRFGT